MLNRKPRLMIYKSVSLYVSMALLYICCMKLETPLYKSTVFKQYEFRYMNHNEPVSDTITPYKKGTLAGAFLTIIEHDFACMHINNFYTLRGYRKFSFNSLLRKFIPGCIFFPELLISRRIKCFFCNRLIINEV